MPDSGSVEEISNALRVEGEQHLLVIHKIADSIDKLYRDTGADLHWLEYPLRYRPVRITGEFGTPYTVGGVSWTHEGLDISVPVGETVYACASGEVVIADTRKGYGRCIRIEHIWQGERWWTWYAHLSVLVAGLGGVVECGSPIALSGNTGNSTGAHLHLTVQREGDKSLLPGCSKILTGCVNPLLYVRLPIGATALRTVGRYIEVGNPKVG